MLDSNQQLYLTDLEQAYDLWKHNCNTFSHDFAMFLVGKPIPLHITNLPDKVLESPFGRMLKPMIDDKIRGDKLRQAGLLGLSTPETQKVPPQSTVQHLVAVKLPFTMDELEVILKRAEKSCAVIFFTSQTCGPCRPLYPVFEQLAQEAGAKAEIIKVDIGRSQDITQKYQITATPTFITFLHGKQESRWSGADGSRLRSQTQTLIQMAWPPHQHESLRLPALRGADTKPVLFNKSPPLEKLMTKIGPTSNTSEVQDVKRFIVRKQSEGAAEAPLPDVASFSLFLRQAAMALPPEIMFAIIDLHRVAMADTRYSGYFAEENDHKTMRILFDFTNNHTEAQYALRLVTLQLGCNLFSSPLYTEHILGCPELTQPIIRLITSSLLDDTHHNVRVAASSLAFNIAVSNSQRRTEERREVLPEEEQVELAASLLEAIRAEEDSPEALKGYLLALGYLVFCAPTDSEIVDLLRSMEAGGAIMDKKKSFPKESLVQELGYELMTKGLGECHK